MHLVGITMDLPNTTGECQTKLKTVQAAIRMQIKDSIQLLLHEMEDRAKLVALDGRSTKNAKPKEMRNAEKTTEMFCWIKVI
jgi:hypothetical protein